MEKGFFKVPKAINEPVLSYATGSQEREQIIATYAALYNSNIEVPLYIQGEEIKTGDTAVISPPHEHQHQIGTYHKAQKSHVDLAIDTALRTKKKWSGMHWEHRAAIFLKAAELIAGPYRAKINAATMLAQSKTIHQAEIDAACEFVDFLRFNVEFMTRIYADQPQSTSEVWNRVEYRPLEGFVYAITPFNFTAISGNLPASPAMMGNVVIWKPSDSQVYSAHIIMEIFKEAGLPDGVIQMLNGDPLLITDVMLKHPEFSGLHFTGSSAVFKSLWTKIGANIAIYKNFPRIVGETGGKDFILAHPSANVKEVATAISRGAFEFQGQKCSAASRAYLPKSLWSQIKSLVLEDLSTFAMGTPQNLNNFITSVIHEVAFDRIVSYIEQAKADPKITLVAGGNHDKTKGYFIEPTILLTQDPNYVTMSTELFGPVITIYVYSDKDWSDTLQLIDSTSDYALTGAVFSRDRYAIEEATQALVHAAGNFYINDKPTGAVVGQQPFGGSRASGTNDKAGSAMNLLRWVSPRTIKETFVPSQDYRYPYLG